MDGTPTRRRQETPATVGWRGIRSAFCASLVGIGLARFAYTPLLPAIVGAHWFQASAAAYLGAANLAGYLAGALLGRPIAERLPVAVTLRVMMLLATAAFGACADPLSFSWFFGWRFAAGFAGGAIMVLAAPAVLPHVPAARRGLAGGMIFMGVGTGIAVSGTLVPLLLQAGLRGTWLGLGGLSLLLTLVAWGGWPGATTPSPGPVALHHASGRGVLRALYLEYGLNAAGWVPHMLFLVDFVARGLGQGVAVGAEYWVLFGFGAMIGPVLAGHVADRIGFGSTLRLAFVADALAIAIPVLGLGGTWLLASSITVGAFVTGTPPLVLGRIRDLLPRHPARQQAAWGMATVVYALLQAMAAYGHSFIFARSGGDYRLLFATGAAAVVLALAIDLIAATAVARMPRARQHPARDTRAATSPLES